MAPRTRSRSSDGGSRSPVFTEIEQRWLDGHEGTALDLLAEHLPNGFSVEELAILRHSWPARLERMHPAALDQTRRARWEHVAAHVLRRPTMPEFTASRPPGTIDFPVIGRGGLRDRILRIHIDQLDGTRRRDRLPDAKSVTPRAREAVQIALRAVRRVLGTTDSFAVTISGAGIAVDDESLGLPVALAAVGASLAWSIPERLCVTGRVTEDGAVHTVAGLDRKRQLVAGERPLADLLGPDAIPTLPRAIARVFQPDLDAARAQYRDLLRAEVRYADRSRFARVGLGAAANEELSRVYVDPDLLPDAQDREWHRRERELARAVEEPGLTEPERDARRRSYRTWTGREFGAGAGAAAKRAPWRPIVEAHTALVLCGDPGMGKSTILARIALDALDGARTSEGRSQSTLPVRLSAAEAIGDESLAAFAIRAVRSRWPDAPREVQTAVGIAIDDGAVTLLIDGLNEADDAQRSRLIDRLRAWRTIHPTAQCVITSRRWALDTISLPVDFRVFHLAGLTDDQSYALVRQNSAGRDAAAWRTLRFIQSRTALREIARNPLLLMLTARLTDEEIERLDHWVDVYERAVPLLMRGPEPDSLGPPMLRRHLRGWAAVADDMQRRSAVLIREHDARRLLAATLPGAGDAAERGADEMIAAGLQHAGLLVRRGARDLGFWHPSFQEYFAAVEWSNAVDADADGSVDRVRAALGPLVRKREHHEALRLMLGRLAFHLGDAQARIATALIERTAEQPDPDGILDGAWLRLAIDAVLDGVPAPESLKEKLGARLAARLQRFDDFAGAEQLSTLVERLLTGSAGGSAVQPLADLLDKPERVPIAVLESAMRMFAAATRANEVARDACRRMYERTRPADGKSLNGFGWKSAICPIAALGLLRAGIVPDGHALSLLAPRLSSHSLGSEEIVNAIQTNAAAAATAIHPYLSVEDPDVRSSAFRLFAVARPESSEARTFVEHCWKNHETQEPWIRAMCRASEPARSVFFAAAESRSSDDVATAVGVLLESGSPVPELVERYVRWLLPRRFTTDVAYRLPHAPHDGRKRGDLFVKALHGALTRLADKPGDASASRAIGWLATIFKAPETEPSRAAWLERLCLCAKDASTRGAAEWIQPLLGKGLVDAASAVVVRLLRDGTAEDVEQAVDIVTTEDLTEWPAAIWNTAEERMRTLVSTGPIEIVFLCTRLFYRRHPPPGVVEVMRRLLAGGHAEAAWKASGWLAMKVGMDREIALVMLRTADAGTPKDAFREMHHLRMWLERDDAGDDEVLRALVEFLIAPRPDEERYEVSYLWEVVAKRAAVVDHLVNAMRDADVGRRKRAYHYLSVLCYVARKVQPAFQRTAERWVNDPGVGIDVLRALVNDGVDSDVVRVALRALADRTDEVGEWAAETLSNRGETSPQHWRNMERWLASGCPGDVLDAASALLSEKRRPAELVPALRRCLAGTPVEALRAAFILFGLEEDIEEFVPRLIECLSLEGDSHVWESRFVEDRRRRLGLRPSRAWNDITVTDSETGEVIRREKYPEPTGRERFRPIFGVSNTIAEDAASLLVEAERPEVIPVLVQWLHAPKERRRHRVLEMIRFLGAQTRPDVIDWLLDRVGGDDDYESESASRVLFEEKIAPERHVQRLLECLRPSTWYKRRSVGIRVITLCALAVDAARTAAAYLHRIEVPFAWRVSRWLIGVGHSTEHVAAIYVGAELSLMPGYRSDEVLELGGKETPPAAWRALFVYDRLGTDRHVNQAWIDEISKGTPEQRVNKVEKLLPWLRSVDSSNAKISPAVVAEGPLRDAVVEALRSALRSDDSWIRGVAVEDLHDLGVFDEEVAEAATLCMVETFGDGPERPLWGEEMVPRIVWEDWAGNGRLRAANVLIAQGRNPAVLPALRSAVECIPHGVNGDHPWLEIVKLLLEHPAEREGVGAALKRWLAERGSDTLYFDQVLALLDLADVDERFIRAAVLDRFAQGDSFATHLVSRWAAGGPAYSARDAENPARWEADRAIDEREPSNGNAADSLRTRLEWLTEQNLPVSTLLYPLALVTCFYDEVRAAELTRTIELTRGAADSMGLDEQLSAREEDGAGQRLAKAWLLSHLAR